MEKEFVNGLRVFKPHEKAPDFIKLDMSIEVSDLLAWLGAREEKELRIQVKESKKGKLYAEVDNWKKEHKSERPAYAKKPVDDGLPKVDYPTEDINPEEIPF